MALDPGIVDACARQALAEDLGEPGDITARCSVPAAAPGVAEILARRSGVLAGRPVAEACFRALDPGVEFGPGVAEGEGFAADDVLMTVRGSARALLSAERTALNFLQRLSGVASRTAEYVAVVADLGVAVLDTRKTTPLLRHLEKHAVAVGGGTNHRIGLYDQILLKENHFALADEPYEAVVRRAVAGATAPVVAEAQTVEEGLAAVAGGAEIVLLDNFEPGAALRSTVDRLRAAAAASGRSVQMEASGGVTLSNLRAFAESGVDRISVGALTHSVEALDMSMLTRRTT